MSCLSVKDPSWAQKLMVQDKQIEEQLKKSNGSDLDEEDFASVHGRGMLLMCQVYKTCLQNYDRAHLKELRTKCFADVKIGEDIH